MSDINKNKIAAIRRKIKAGTASDLEKAMVEQWTREHPRGRPGGKSKMDTQTNPDTPVHGDGAPSAAGAPQVESTLPGMENTTETSIPPINVSPNGPNTSQNANAGAANTNTSPHGGNTQSTHTASTVGTNSNPRMNSAEQEASAEMIATMASKLLSGFNDYNKEKGFPALTPELVSLFHFSTKRMAMRYGANVNEEQFDATVIVGMSGFVGYQSWRAYSEDTEESARKAKIKTPGVEPSGVPFQKEKVIIDEQRNPPASEHSGANGTVKQPIGAITRFPNPRFNPKGIW